jgi:hypothetical protein
MLIPSRLLFFFFLSPLVALEFIEQLLRPVNFALQVKAAPLLGVVRCHISFILLQAYTIFFKEPKEEQHAVRNMEVEIGSLVSDRTKATQTDRNTSSISLQRQLTRRMISGLAASCSVRFKTWRASVLLMAFLKSDCVASLCVTPAFRAFWRACAYAAGKARANTATTGTTNCANSRASGPTAIIIRLVFPSNAKQKV